MTAMRCLFLVVLAFTPTWCFADFAEPPSLFIEGYPASLSVAAGEEAAFHISTSAPTFDAKVERIGLEKKLVWEKKNLPGAAYPVPDDASANGCKWPESFRLPITEDWKTGYYQMTLSVSDNGGAWTRKGLRQAQGRLFFVVRNDSAQRQPILLQLTTNTYNAYTNYGGYSFYAYHAIAKNQGHRVSFERPIYSQFERWELPFIEWAEANNIPLDYAVNSDLEFHPEVLKGRKLMLSVGHDEYWSGPMRDTVESFIAQGGNVAFFSGNTCCWQVRSEDGGKAMTSWKQNYVSDPIWQSEDKSTLSSLWSHRATKRPENQMTGVGFLRGGYRNSHGQFMGEPAEYTVHRPEHWIFAGTDLKKDSVFGGKDTIVGYECDGCEMEWRDGLPFAKGNDGTPKNFEILATCPVRWHPDDAAWYDGWNSKEDGASTLGIYTQGGTVFTTGSTDWAHGLKGKDAAVMQITKNIIDRLGR